MGTTRKPRFGGSEPRRSEPPSPSLALPQATYDRNSGRSLHDFLLKNAGTAHPAVERGPRANSGWRRHGRETGSVRITIVPCCNASTVRIRQVEFPFSRTQSHHFCFLRLGTSDRGGSARPRRTRRWGWRRNRGRRVRTELPARQRSRAAGCRCRTSSGRRVVGRRQFRRGEPAGLSPLLPPQLGPFPSVLRPTGRRIRSWLGDRCRHGMRLARIGVVRGCGRSRNGCHAF